MYQFHISEMAKAVAKALEQQASGPEVNKAISQALNDYWSRRAAIVWSVEDVMGECPGLTEEQAHHVLYSAISKHDANDGLNWDRIYSSAGYLFGEKAFEEEEEKTFLASWVDDSGNPDHDFAVDADSLEELTAAVADEIGENEPGILDAMRKIKKEDIATGHSLDGNNGRLFIYFEED